MRARTSRLGSLAADQDAFGLVSDLHLGKRLGVAPRHRSPSPRVSPGAANAPSPLRTSRQTPVRIRYRTRASGKRGAISASVSGFRAAAATAVMRRSPPRRPFQTGALMVQARPAASLTADEEGEQACRGSVSYRSRHALGLIQRIGLPRKLAPDEAPLFPRGPVRHRGSLRE
jgi:hypothetical protein